MPIQETRSSPSEEDLASYTGRWVAIIKGKVVGQGGTPEQAQQAARVVRYKETPELVFVPTARPLVFHPLLDQVVARLPGNVPVYLVGGSVRDALLGRTSHDLDFILAKGAMETARRLADGIGAAYYPLDRERDIARLVLRIPGEERVELDFASFRGSDLESDLRARDFTLNAIAVDIRHPQVLLDPLGGLADLLASRLRACSPTAFMDDPLRILRAIRLAAAYRFHILPETRSQMHAAVKGLSRVSAERARDELFKIFEGPQPAVALSALEYLGVLPFLLPEIEETKGISQSPPHTSDVWQHTLEVTRKLEVVLAALDAEYNAEKAANLPLGLLVLRLGRFRQQICEYLETRLNPNRSLRSLLFLAALYHDTGKPLTRQVEPSGRIRFFQHEHISAEMVMRRAQNLCLSNIEIEWLRTVVQNHMRPFQLAQALHIPGRKAVYRFFRDTGQAGVGVCLLSLADILAISGIVADQSVWRRHLDIIRVLLEARWEGPKESLSPVAVINGRELLKEFELQPGPLIGQLLEAIREAQAAGEVSNRQQALELAKKLLEEEKQ